MKHVIRAAIVAAIGLATPFAAQAADLARVPNVYKVAPPVAVWTGCYFGFNIGGAWSQATITDGVTGVGLGSVSPGGFVGGGQLGCDYQTGLFVFGIQGMANMADVRGSQLQPNGLVTNYLNIPWIETLTGRIGYAAFPSTLLYVKGGAAWVRDNITTTFGGATVGTGIITPNGWTIGIGAEFMFFNTWSAFAEYNYAGFGNNQVSLIPAAVGAGVAININHNQSQRPDIPGRIELPVRRSVLAQLLSAGWGEGYATTLARKVSTSPRSSATAASTACEPSSMVRAQALVWVAASVTLPSTDAAAVVPSAAWATLREI
jgi:outer membrane immunogenic protein